MASKHRKFDELSLVESLLQGQPSGIGDAVVTVELVDGTKEDCLHGRPPLGTRARDDPANLVRREPGGLSNGHVMRPLIAGVAKPRHPQNDEFPVPPEKATPLKEFAREANPSPKEAGMTDERGKDIECSVAADGSEQFTLLLRLLLGGKWFDSGRGRTIGHKNIIPTDERRGVASCRSSSIFVSNNLLG